MGLPGVEYRLLESSGHNPQLENPDLVRRELLKRFERSTCQATLTFPDIPVEDSLALNAFGAGEFKIDSRNGVNVPTTEPGDQAPLPSISGFHQVQRRLTLIASTFRQA